MIKKLRTGHLFIFIFLLIVPLVYSSSVADPALSPRLFAMDIFLLGFVFIGFFMDKKIICQGLKIAFRHPLFKVYGIYLLISGISCFFAINTSEAVFEWFKQFGFFLFLFLLVIYVPWKKSAIPYLIKIINLYTVLILARGIYEIFTLSELTTFNHQSSYFIRAFSANRNLFAQMLFLVLPLNIYGIYRLKKPWRIFSMINSLVLLVFILLLLTRSVWLATFIAFTVAAKLILLFNQSFQIKPKIKKKALFGIAGLIIVIASGIFLYARFGNPEFVKKQGYWLSNYKYGSSFERLGLWKKTFQMGKDHALTGVGPGNWRIVAPEYGLVNLRDETGDTLFQRPHNDFLWVFAESGMAGMVLYLLIFVFAIYSLMKIIRKEGSQKNKYLALALLSGLSGYLVIALLSFPKERIEHQLFIHAYLAFVILLDQKPESKKHRNNKLAHRLIFLLIFLVQGFGTYLALSRFRSEIHIKEAFEARIQKDWNHVIEQIDKASTLITTMDVYSTPLEWYKGESLFILDKPKQALSAFQKAYRANPNHVHVLNNMASCFELTGQREKAKQFYRKSLSVFPGFKESLLNMCAIYYNENKLDSAYRMLQIAEDSVKSERHQYFLKTVLWKYTETLRQSVDDRIIAKSLERIRNDENWMLKVHGQACQSEDDFKNELFREVIFLLESVDSSITSEDAQKFRINYLRDTIK